jgi:hypothetical protein
MTLMGETIVTCPSLLRSLGFAANSCERVDLQTVSVGKVASRAGLL